MSDDAALAYVFWHWRRPSVARTEYEAHGARSDAGVLHRVRAPGASSIPISLADARAPSAVGRRIARPVVDRGSHRVTRLHALAR